MNEDSRDNGVVGNALKGVGAVTAIAGASYGIDKAMMSDAATNMIKGKNRKDSPLRGIIGKYRMTRKDFVDDINNYKKEQELAKNVSGDSSSDSSKVSDTIKNKKSTPDTSSNSTKATDTVKNKKYTYTDESYNRAQDLMGAREELRKTKKQRRYMRKEMKNGMNNNPDYLDAFENVKKNIKTDYNKTYKIKKSKVTHNVGNVTVKKAKSGVLSKATRVISKIK